MKRELLLSTPHPTRHQFRSIIDQSRAAMIAVAEAGVAPDAHALDTAITSMTRLLLSLTPDDDDD
jgi:hypothetical protein